MKSLINFLKKSSFKSFRVSSNFLIFSILMFSFSLCIFSIIYSITSVRNIFVLEESLQDFCKISESQKMKKTEESQFFQKLKASDPYYIDKHLENLKFLEEEVQNLQILSRTNPSDGSLKQRLNFLKEGANKLRFSEENLHRHKELQEVEENQQHPVEINVSDLKKLLTYIEGINIAPFEAPLKAPQLIIKHFDLFKKPVSGQEETYLIQMKLIKREPIHE